MTNLSAMRAIAELNKLQEVRNKEQAPQQKEVKNENINLQLIVESALESYNKQLGAKSLNIQELNDNNKGLLKVFKDKKSYGQLAKKYKYGYMYNFFSGDIHLLSQIDKLIPFNTNHSKQYYDIYLNCILTLLKDYFLLINDYNTEVKVDVTKLNQINFIEIKDSWLDGLINYLLLDCIEIIVIKERISDNNDQY